MHRTAGLSVACLEVCSTLRELSISLIELNIALSLDKSLAATQETVRKKLDLGPDVKFDLVQLRNGTRVDLEDGELCYELSKECF